MTEAPAIFVKEVEVSVLMQRMRDEAHRVALRYQRRTRKRTTRSALHDVPGLGPEKAKALMRAFGSVAAIRRASPDELQAVPGIGPSLAERIRATLTEVAPVSGDGAEASEMLSPEVPT